MYPELTDEALTDLLRRNDPLALETLFNRYYKSLCQYCTVYSGDYEVSEELVADLFIRLWDSRKESAIINVRSYLFISAKNRSLNHRQKKKDPVFSIEELDAGQVFQETETPFHILSCRESYQKILRLIELLPLRQREVLLMSRIDNMDKNQISELLGISVRTVETTLYQSIKQLRVLLKGSFDFTSGN